MRFATSLKGALLTALVATIGASFVSTVQAATLDFDFTIDNTYFIPTNGYPSGVPGDVTGVITLQQVAGNTYTATAIDITAIPAGAAGSTGPYAIDSAGSNSFVVTGGNTVTNANLIGSTNVMLGFNWSLAAGGFAYWQSQGGCSASEPAGSCTVVGSSPEPEGEPQIYGTLSFELAPVATPLPAALPLFAAGLGALGLFGWRRKRKTVALAAV
jgi:hypothetical protein